ncbi:hypothetical protein G5I_08757 [Acromyrmex echinatior]|uniref:Uncharacterized protein n=1 Tax=Acromyrmex echinatior TaxID=103372 RepID=F4WSD1_ACREC|nr:hypothetical protein G5I_08757 [Acromyrmex echinatior]
MQSPQRRVMRVTQNAFRGNTIRAMDANTTNVVRGANSAIVLANFTQHSNLRSLKSISLRLFGKSILASSTTEASEIFFTITEMYRENALHGSDIKKSIVDKIFYIKIVRFAGFLRVQIHSLNVNVSCNPLYQSEEQPDTVPPGRSFYITLFVGVVGKQRIEGRGEGGLEMDRSGHFHIAATLRTLLRNIMQRNC